MSIPPLKVMESVKLASAARGPVYPIMMYIPCIYITNRLHFAVFCSVIDTR